MKAATDDDGSCEVLGCTYALASNYNDRPRTTMGRASFNLSVIHVLGIWMEVASCS